MRQVIVNVASIPTQMTHATLHMWVAGEYFNARYLSGLLNGIESLLYECILQATMEIVSTFPGVTDGSISFEPMRKAKKYQDYQHFYRIRSEFYRSYESFLVNRYIFGRIPDDRVAIWPHHEERYRDFIGNKLPEKPDFDHHDFLEWARSRSSGQLTIREIHTGGSLEFFLDFATIAAIIALQEYPVMKEIAKVFIARLKIAANKFFANPKSSEKELIRIIKNREDTEIVILEGKDTPKNCDIYIGFGEGQFVRYKHSEKAR